MTRLYNHTRYDDALLKDILNFAARANDIKGDVPVKLTYTRHRIHGAGMAYNGRPYRKTLIGKPTTSKDKRLLQCPTGWIEASPPRVLERPWVKPDHSDYKDRDTLALEAAEWFVDLCIHEMAHIRQYRTGFMNSSSANGHVPGRNRRIAHDSRPCEIDAENAVYDVHTNRARNRRRQELALQLAEHLIG